MGKALDSMEPGVALALRLEVMAELVHIFNGYAETNPPAKEFYEVVVAHLKTIGDAYVSNYEESVCRPSTPLH